MTVSYVTHHVYTACMSLEDKLYTVATKMLIIIFTSLESREVLNFSSLGTMVKASKLNHINLYGFCNNSRSTKLERRFLFAEK